MSPDELPESLILTEAQVRQAIGLAARAVPHSEGVSLAQLRQIAQELDIEQEALLQAVRDVLAGRGHLVSRRSWFSRVSSYLGTLVTPLLPQRGRALVGSLIGGSLGWLTAHVALGFREVING